MSKSKKHKQQANIQSGTIDMNGFSEGIAYGGTMTENMRIDEDMDSGITYSFGDLGQLNLFSEEDMREKYPALKQAYEHYQSVLEVCKTKEKEDEN